MANEAWIERQTRTPEARRRYEEERLILWTTEAICEAMEERGLNRAASCGSVSSSAAGTRPVRSSATGFSFASACSLTRVWPHRDQPNADWST